MYLLKGGFLITFLCYKPLPLPFVNLNSKIEAEGTERYFKLISLKRTNNAIAKIDKLQKKQLTKQNIEK